MISMITMIFALGAVTDSDAQPTAVESKDPTLEQIMSDPDWIGRSPASIGWSWDGSAVLFDQKREGSRLSDRWRIGAQAGAEAELIADAERPFVSSRRVAFDADHENKVFSRSGDVFVRTMDTGKLTQLTRSAAVESGPIFMTNRSVAFVRSGNWFIIDSATGLERQAADVRTEDDPEIAEQKERDEDKDYLEEQQRRLFAIVRDREAREDARDKMRDARKAADPTRVAGPFWLGDGLRVHFRALSPGGRWLALAVSEDPGEDRNDEMPAFVNEDGYVSTSSVRTKVGIEKLRSDEIVLIDLEAERVHRMGASGLPTILDDPLEWLKEDSAEGDDSVEDGSNIDDVTDADADADAEEDEKAGPRSFMVEQISWSPDGEGVFFVLHSNDNKDRWIVTADLDEISRYEADADESDEDDGPMLSAIHHLRDEAWINWQYNEAGWTHDSSSVWYLSEETGYSHLYMWEAATGATSPMTNGKFTVRGVVESHADSRFYFRMNRENPGIYEVGSVGRNDDPLGSRFLLRAETEGGGSVDSFVISPDGTRLAYLFSTAMDPPEIYVQDIQPGSEPERLTHTDSNLFRSFDWVEPRFIQVPSTHSDDPIYCRVYDDPTVPAPSDAGKPVVLFSHGAGYTQHVYNGWSYYFREHMFHTLLSRAGYIVIAPDFRASAGYGRDWRTAIYRNMGRPELEDFDDSLAWLDANYDVDLENTGIYGGSYGGFMTLMAMFLRPDVYECGAALRSVTDWAHYNHPYTSNILNTPEVDPEAYERSSPIEYAENLEGALLMCHGMLDDNVVAQDTIRLAQRLIELEKEDWEMALYPIEPHGFMEPTGWLDEYRRIFKLFETHLKD